MNRDQTIVSAVATIIVNVSESRCSINDIFLNASSFFFAGTDLDFSNRDITCAAGEIEQLYAQPDSMQNGNSRSIAVYNLA